MQWEAGSRVCVAGMGASPCEGLQRFGATYQVRQGAVAYASVVPAPVRPLAGGLPVEQAESEAQTADAELNSDGEVDVDTGAGVGVFEPRGRSRTPRRDVAVIRSPEFMLPLALPLGLPSSSLPLSISRK